jgi:inosine/xanthosine triphosphate pyrophosphatase family protein
MDNAKKPEWILRGAGRDKVERAEELEKRLKYAEALNALAYVMLAHKMSIESHNDGCAVSIGPTEIVYKDYGFGYDEIFAAAREESRAAMDQHARLLAELREAQGEV